MSEPETPPSAVPAQFHPGGPSQPRRFSGVVKWLVIGAIVVGLGVLALFATCMYIGVAGPSTKVLPGRQVPRRYVEKIRELDLLESDEQIQYFYSDALMNIEEGFYLLTDRKVVVYSRTFEEPAIIVPFGDIFEVEGDFSDDWLTDSLITLTLKDGTDVTFPASMEGGGDRRMYDALKKNAGAAQGL